MRKSSEQWRISAPRVLWSGRFLSLCIPDNLHRKLRGDAYEQSTMLYSLSIQLSDHGPLLSGWPLNKASTHPSPHSTPNLHSTPRVLQSPENLSRTREPLVLDTHVSLVQTRKMREYPPLGRSGLLVPLFVDATTVDGRQNNRRSKGKYGRALKDKAP